MTMTDVRSPERSSAAGPSLIEALERPRYEILPLDGIADDVFEHLPAGRKITLTSSPSRGLEATLRLAEELAPRGYEVVPHLAARLIPDRAHLVEIVLRLRNAGVTEAFVIAGDARQPAGEFEGAAQLLSTMAELREGLAEVGISGYPESHHLISDETTIEAMFEKEPMASYIVSQICFDAEVIRTWIRRVRERGTSLRIGLGQSVRFLRGQRGVLRRFLRPRTYTPTELLIALASSFSEPAAKVGGVHVYTFNELKKTETWRRQLVDRLTNQEEPPWQQ